MLYLTIDIFIDALVLLLHDRSAEAKSLVDKLLAIYEEQSKDSAYIENEFFEFYADLLREISLAGILAGSEEAEVFILRFKSNPQITKDPELLTTLKKIFLDKSPISLERNKFLFAKVSNAILWYQNAKSVKRMFGKLANNQFTTPEKQQEIFAELNNLCTDIVHMNQSNTTALADEQNIARVVDFSDKTSIAKALEVYSVTSRKNIFHTGLQGMNKALGPKGGFCVGDSIVFNALPFAGKACVDSTPIKIPGGWKSIGDMKVGDVVTAWDGTPSTVTGVFPQGKRQVYRVLFQDGRWVDADGEHLWEVTYRSNWYSHRTEERVRSYKTKIMTTLDMLEYLSLGNYADSSKRRTLRIRLCKSEVGEDIALPLDPYVLGVLLGDGSVASGRSASITTDKWICEKISKRLPDGVSVSYSSYSLKKYTNGYTVSANLISEQRPNPLTKILEEIGILYKRAWEKSIPEMYLYASTAQRWELLQGLMDTDGCLNKPNVHKNNQSHNRSEFCTTSKQLADQFQYLVRSLGGICSLRVTTPFYTHKGSRKQGRTAYILCPTFNDDSQMFTLPRKLKNFHPRSIPKYLYVKSITPLPEKTNCTCISIDHPDKLYVTKDFIVTHNTACLLKMARWQIMYNKAPAEFRNPTVIVFSLENETPKNTMQLFSEMYINLFGEVPPEELSQEKIIEICYQEFNKMGWRLVVDRRLGAEFGFGELVACFEEYVRLGYTPLMCVIDYMNMMKKSDADRNDLMIRELYTNVRNYLSAKNCTLVTAHQLNRKAAECVRQNPMGAVKRFDSSMLSDAMDPQRELDIVFYINKETDAAGHAYLTFKLDKHRYDTETPESDKYFAYAFHGPLGIVDDINTHSRSCKNIFAYDYEKNDIELHGGKIEKSAIEPPQGATVGVMDLMDESTSVEVLEPLVESSEEPSVESTQEPQVEQKPVEPPVETPPAPVEVDAKGPEGTIDTSDISTEETGFIIPKKK